MDDSTGRDLWLVRHGESVANAGHASVDYAKIALTRRGYEQSESVVVACSEPPAWVGMSPFLRARETAQQLLERYPSTRRVELPVQEFTYLDLHDRDEMDATTRKPLVDAYWARMNPDYCDGENAESFLAFWSRARDFLEWASAQEGHGIVFTHEQFIRAVLVIAIAADARPTVNVMEQFFALRSGLPIPNCAIVKFRWVDQRWWVGGIDTTHLADGTSPKAV